MKDGENHRQSFRLIYEIFRQDFSTKEMSATQESQAIEVEVLEIDGVVPVIKPEPSAGARPAWQDWQGRVRQLDSRWWPLWLLLGIIFVLLALTVGVVLGLVFVIFAVIRRFLRMLLR